MTNEFGLISGDEIGELTQVGFEEIFEETVDMANQSTKVSINMNRKQYKEQQRNKRIENSNTGFRIGQLVTGKQIPTYDNSHLWEIQKAISMEIAPTIRRLQVAWANQNQ